MYYLAIASHLIEFAFYRDILFEDFLQLDFVNPRENKLRPSVILFLKLGTTFADSSLWNEPCMEGNRQIGH